MQSGDLIGRPIESILESAKEFIPSPLPANAGRLRSQVIASKKPCQLLVIPVTDRFRSPHCGMSHLLVKVEPLGAVNFVSVDENVASAIDTLDQKSPAQHHMFGTVG